jgi:hypothetical protein
MTRLIPYPLFSVVLRDDDRWTIEAEWPDGTIEQVTKFKAYSDARKWLNNGSQSWVQQRTGD